MIVSPDFVTEELETELVLLCKQELDSRCQGILPEGRSRIARIGHAYSSEAPPTPIPDWLRFCPANTNSVTINEYLPGRGILPHVDSERFGDPVSILSLNSTCEMSFFDPGAHETVVFLPRRSMLRLTGESRFWKHGIAERDHDFLDGEKIMRGTRYSLVFRKKL